MKQLHLVLYFGDEGAKTREIPKTNIFYKCIIINNSH